MVEHLMLKFRMFTVKLVGVRKFRNFTVCFDVNRFEHFYGTYIVILFAQKIFIFLRILI